MNSECPLKLLDSMPLPEIRGDTIITKREPQFEYGPLARGSYHAMLALVLVIPVYFPAYALYYIGFVAFLGLGLRPLLERTGLYRLMSSLLVKVSSRHYRNFDARRQREIDQKMRDAKYRGGHKRNPKLPKNW